MSNQLLTRLTARQQYSAVEAIRLAWGIERNLDEFKDAPQRVRNFIRINYRREYTLNHCRRIWNRFKNEVLHV